MYECNVWKYFSGRVANGLLVEGMSVHPASRFKWKICGIVFGKFPVWILAGTQTIRTKYFMLFSIFPDKYRDGRVCLKLGEGFLFPGHVYSLLTSYLVIQHYRT
jgi:hypothetical protein